MSKKEKALWSLVLAIVEIVFFFVFENKGAALLGIIFTTCFGGYVLLSR